MTAPRGYGHLTGKGRPNRTPTRVPDVETLPCPERPGPHWLINAPERGGLVTVCRGCRKSWSELDAEIRGEAS